MRTTQTVLTVIMGALIVFLAIKLYPDLIRYIRLSRM